MRLAIPLLALAAFLSACQHTGQALKWPEEADIRHFLVGAWTSEPPMSGSIVFNADGRFESTTRSSQTIRGTWKDFRPDGSVISVSTGGSVPVLYTIRHIDAHLLVLLPPFASGPPQEPLRFIR